MNEEELKRMDFNTYVKFFNEGELIANISTLKTSYTAKKYNDLVLIIENIALCKTYEEDECHQYPEWYCRNIKLDDILALIETKIHKKTEYVKVFSHEDMCSITNDYVFLLK